MLKTFALLFCLSVTLGVGYSASKGTTTATPTASNTTSTAKPTTTAKPTSGNTTAKPTTGNTTAKPTATTKPTTKPTTGNATAKPSAKSTTKPTTTAKPTTGNATAKPSNKSTTKPTTTAKPTTGNVTAKPSNKSSTKPTTTAKPTTGNATEKPSNKSSTKPTTTAKPYTGSSTSSKPTKGSTTEKTTTVLPTTLPPYGTFSLHAKGPNTTEYCLLAQFAVTFTINYMANVFKDNSSKIVVQEKKNGTIYLNRTNSENVKIDGDCGSNSSEAKLVLTWPKKNPFYILTMVFSEMVKGLEAKSNSKWGVKKYTLDVTLKNNTDFKNATEESFTSTFNGSSAPTYGVGGYYSCKSKDPVKFETTTTNYSVQSVFEDVKLEPFVYKPTDHAFGNNTYQCYQDNPTKAPTSPTEPSGNNDIVPIAVGCALAGLVLIVLIAYIIGRRKSHRGYEKV